MFIKGFIRLWLVIALSAALVGPAWAAAPQSAGLQGQLSFEVTTPDSLKLVEVPGVNNTNLVTALSIVSNGGTILLSEGVYSAPNNGYTISNLNKSFTVRAAEGETVVISGNDSTRLFSISNTPSLIQGSITFQGIIFSNGRSSSQGTAGGVSISDSNVTFIESTFQDNIKTGYRVNTTGGAVLVTDHSKVFFFNSRWENNSSEDGGAGLATRDSEVHIHSSSFIGNQTHATATSSIPVGGAINIVNSTVRITNTHFEANRSGGHGGAVYILGQWTTTGSDVVISNSTFENNGINRTIAYSDPIEGGAINIEDNSKLKIYHSRFIKNSAGLGGAVNSFRSKVEIYNSTMLGNRATDTTPSSGFGGAISFNYYDRPDASSMRIEDTLIQGRYENITTVAQFGGGIHAHGNATQNYPDLTLRRVILNDLDTTTVANKGTLGGGLELSGVDLLIEDSFVLNCDALGPLGGSGGGMIVYPRTNVEILRSVFAHNSSETYGGAISIIGSELNITDSLFYMNEVSPGSRENPSYSYGAALYTSPDAGGGLSMNGMIVDSIFVKNAGVPIYDEDRTSGPTNNLQYENNQFFEPTYAGKVYHDSLTEVKIPDGLNDLLVIRSGSTTDKSLLNSNVALQVEPRLARLLAAPGVLLSTAAYGENGTNTTSSLAYVWNGSTAELDGEALSMNAGVQTILEAGRHMLTVDGELTNEIVLLLNQAPEISTSIIRTDPYLSLSWNVQGGSFLTISADQGLDLPPERSGTIQLPADDRVYYLYSVTSDGGVLHSADPRVPLLSLAERISVLVGLNYPLWEQSVPLANTGGQILEWSAQTDTPHLIQLLNTSGSFAVSGVIPYIVTIDQPGQYTANILVDAGAAGSRLISLDIKVVDQVFPLYLSTVLR